ncbi:MAG TPA: serine/threonine-protein kinase [Gemmatimonadaceae bacterium]|nr:serine/threonine-protein kinase [Gemmatimonadaceae bacterium]
MSVTPPNGVGSRPGGTPAPPDAAPDTGISPLVPGASSPHSVTAKLPSHIESWQLPAGWSWGAEGVLAENRHYQEVVDALGRSLSLVTVPDPAHPVWLGAEARALAHRAHSSIPTAYDWWPGGPQSRRGPAYVRRWISGESVAGRIRRVGPDDLGTSLQLLRSTGLALAYLHTTGTAHGAVCGESIWLTPTGQLWLLAWEWALPRNLIPAGLMPFPGRLPRAPEWPNDEWLPTPESDQWQLAATAFASLTGEYPPADVPPLPLVRPDCPQAVARVLNRALERDPEKRYHSVAAMLRELERAVGGGGRSSLYISGSMPAIRPLGDAEEERLRWATGEDYEVIARLGSGTFGSVWRVRDLTLEREVALKMLHPQVANDEIAVRRFRREAQLAAQLAHPAIVPIYDWDSNGGVSWYTMELAENGSLTDLVKRSGPRLVEQIASHVDQVLDGLAAAHAIGIVHRDLKPENILIDRHRRWRIADFGVAKITGEELLSSTTGTPEFAAPEQLLGEGQGPQVDCFGLAAIVTYLLSGEPPFGVGDGRAILGRELSGDVDLSGYPEAIAEWLERGLAPVAEQRFADAAEMRDAWRRAVDRTLAPESRPPWWRRWWSGEEGAAEGDED